MKYGANPMGRHAHMTAKKPKKGVKVPRGKAAPPTETEVGMPNGNPAPSPQSPMAGKMAKRLMGEY